MRILILGMIVTSFGLLLPDRVEALVRAGTLRPSLETSVLGVNAGKRDRGDEADLSDVHVGLGNSAIPGFGVAVIDRLLIGGRVALHFRHNEVGGWERNDFGWDVLPYAEYIFLDGVACPFVTATLGIEGWTIENPDMWKVAFYVGGGGGAHFFFHERISLDATLLLGFSVGGGEEEADPDIEFVDVLFRLSTFVGFSGWF